MKYLQTLPLFVLALALFGCSAVQPVRVLPKGQTLLTASLGGPIVPSSSPAVIIPYTTVGMLYGADSTLTIGVSVHLLAAVFKVAGLDVGAAYRLCHESGMIPEFTAKAQCYAFFPYDDFGSIRIIPHFGCIGSYRVGERGLVYFGGEYTYQFTGKDKHFLTPLLGWQLPVSSTALLSVEAKWMAATSATAHGVFEGEGALGGHGALGVFGGITFPW